MAIYLKYDTIPGNVTAKGFEGQIKIETCSFGCGRGISMESGNMSNREASRPSLSEVTLGHKLDISAALLFQEAVSGSAAKNVEISFVQTGPDDLQTFMTYKLEGVLVSGYSISAEGDSDPYETISLSYSKITVEYQDHDEKNASKGKMVAAYDVEKGCKV